MEIKDITTLLNYIENKHNNQFSVAFYNLINNDKPKHKHFNNTLESYITSLAKLKSESIVVTASNLSNKSISGYCKVLNIYGAIYFQEIGSYMTGNNISLDYNSKVESKYLQCTSKKISEKDIKITKYIYGKHYYVKVGNKELGKYTKPEIANQEAKNYIKIVNNERQSG